MIVMLVTKVMAQHALMSMNVLKTHVLQLQVQLVETQMAVSPAPVRRVTPVMASTVSTLTSVATIYVIQMLLVPILLVLTYVSVTLAILAMVRNVKM